MIELPPCLRDWDTEKVRPGRHTPGTQDPLDFLTQGPRSIHPSASLVPLSPKTQRTDPEA